MDTALGVAAVEQFAALAVVLEAGAGDGQRDVARRLQAPGVAERLRGLPQQPGKFDFVAPGAPAGHRPPVTVAEQQQAGPGRIVESFQQHVQRMRQGRADVALAARPGERAQGFHDVQMGVEGLGDGRLLVAQARIGPFSPILPQRFDPAAVARIPGMALEPFEQAQGAVEGLGAAVGLGPGGKRVDGESLGVAVLARVEHAAFAVERPVDAAVLRVGEALEQDLGQARRGRAPARVRLDAGEPGEKPQRAGVTDQRARRLWMRAVVLVDAPVEAAVGGKSVLEPPVADPARLVEQGQRRRQAAHRDVPSTAALASIRASRWATAPWLWPGSGGVLRA
ncbi:MAG: hypothetical protein KatS3mg121_0627 [Gammaproteobacteria bacterium]|nr:MAG: hypothetical protein KatS3mg121_0627 [Gammaproteobacteria bacterium]